MASAEDILAIARREVGTCESPAGSNRVKYNTWFYGRAVSGSAYPWCCVFVCWVFAQAGAGALIRMTGGCTTLMNWYRARSRLVSPEEMRPGDLVFYQFDSDAYADHVGIVESVGKTNFTAIEGNTSATSNDNGGKVMRRTRRKSLVMAVARPDYREKEERDLTKAEVEQLVRQELAALTAPKTYDTVDACPAWAQKAVRWAVDAGYVRGDEHGRLALDNNKVWAIQVTYNIMERGRD